MDSFLRAVAHSMLVCRMSEHIKWDIAVLKNGFTGGHAYFARRDHCQCWVVAYWRSTYQGNRIR